METVSFMVAFFKQFILVFLFLRPPHNLHAVCILLPSTVSSTPLLPSCDLLPSKGTIYNYYTNYNYTIIIQFIITWVCHTLCSFIVTLDI